MGLVHTVVAFIVALGVLVFFHELGHYLAARWCGVKILRFSVGFGKTLWMRRFGADQTEWAVAALPLGGFVRMLDEREGPVAADELPRAFNRQTVGKRMFIVAAGPLANFLLAIVVYYGMFMHGIAEPKPILGESTVPSIAASAGIQSGDVVQKVNGVPIRTFGQLRWELLEHAVAKRKNVTLEVLDPKNALVTRVLDLSELGLDSAEVDPLRKLGMRMFRPATPAVIGVTEAASPAQGAGLQAGDHVVAIGDKTIDTWDQLVKIVSTSAGQELVFALQRGTERLSVRITPREAERDGMKVGRIGAGVRADPSLFKDLMVEESFGPIDALGKAITKTWDMSVFSLRMLWKMVMGELSWRNLSGPVTIADYAGQSASLGVMPYLTFIALVSISLGVLNLLPIPVLDGGHLLYYSVELAKGSPVSDRVMEMGQRFGLAVLLCLMVFAFYNDINRLLSG